MALDAKDVVLARHGETEWSRDGKHTGTTDVPLTDEGRRQAESLGPRLRAWTYARVFVSPMQRARVTLELAGIEAPVEVMPDLCEWDYGDYEGLTTPEIRQQRPDWSLWDDGCPGGEAAAQVGARVDRVMAAARAVAADVLLVAHGHVLRVLAARWVGLPPGDGRRFYLSTATVSALGWERESPVITLWNERP